MGELTKQRSIEYQDILSVLDNDNRYIYIVDAETYVIYYANKIATTMWNKKEPYIGKQCYRYVKGLDHMCENCSIPLLKEGEEFFRNPQHYDDQLGLWLDILVARMHWQGRPAYLIKVNDITEEQNNRLQLERDNEVIRAISQQYFEFISIVDTVERTISFRETNLKSENAAPTQGSNYDEDSLYAIDQLVIPEEREMCRRLSRIENITAQLEKKSSYAYTFTQPLSNGKMRRKQLTFWWQDRAKHKLMCIKNDINDAYEQEQEQLKELRRSKLEAERANNAKSRFLANMSHDMRTPMHSILGLATIAQQELNNPEAMQKYWSTVAMAGDYLLALINDVLDMAKIEDNSLRLNPTAYSGKDFVKYLTGLFGEECKRKKITLRFNLPEDPPDMLVDRLRVNQIFFNIFSNAVKFTPVGGGITYSSRILERTPEYVVLEQVVEDTGIGMSEEFQKRMFMPFEQADTNTGERQGTGLGLAITKKLVDLFGGTLSIESKLGVGTKVKVVLKAAVPQLEAEQDEETEQQISLVGKRVLLAEDHALNQLITKKILEREGVVVTCANDGQEALQSFSQSPEGFFDLVLMDMRMPELDGCGATRAIRALPRADAKKVPIIALTANAYAEDVQMAVAAGMNDHLSKPIDVPRFFKVISKWLA